MHWENVAAAAELLEPFSDAIHQIEADRPHLADCLGVLTALRAHVAEWARKHSTPGTGDSDSDTSHCERTGRALATFDRRLRAEAGGGIAPVYNAAYSAAFVLDPYYAEVDILRCEPHYAPPELEAWQMAAAETLVERIGDPAAKSQFNLLTLTGYPSEMQGVAAALAGKRTALQQQRERAPDVQQVGGKREREERATVPDGHARLNVWRRAGKVMPELQAVALRLLSAHATSAASERNWSLWGRIFQAARSSLGIERAKCLIAICAAERGAMPAGDAFEISLNVLEGAV